MSVTDSGVGVSPRAGPATLKAAKRLHRQDRRKVVRLDMIDR